MAVEMVEETIRKLSVGTALMLLGGAGTLFWQVIEYKTADRYTGAQATADKALAARERADMEEQIVRIMHKLGMEP
jgi:hypothetical protein